MKMSIIKRVILTIAAVALFVVPVSIITLQPNQTKTADAAHYNNNKNNCNHLCQGYYAASNNSTSCPVMYYSYITNSYSSCTQVQNPKTNYTTSTYNNSSYCPMYCNTSTYNASPVNYSYPYNNSSYNNYVSYSKDYSYYNPNSYGTYISEPYYDIPVSSPKQDYVDIYVSKPGTYNYSAQKTAYTVGNEIFNRHNSYEALTPDYVYSN
jgi:hypothetical protein